MAPSNVFSYLHGMRMNQRRTNSPSYPTAPPPQAQPDFPLQHPDNHAYPITPRLSDNDIVRSSSPISVLPPTLPPIPRVALRYEGSEAFGQSEGSDGISSTSAERWLDAGQSAPIPLQDPRSARPPSSFTLSHHNDESRIQTVEGTVSGNRYGSSFTRRSLHQSVTAPVSVRPVQSPAVDLLQPSALRADEISPLSRPPQLVLPPAPNARSGKAKLNLLNPMSLLARRRTSQMLPQLASESPDVKNPVIPGMRLPEDYDPRIRGKVVHDFSAPRPRRYHTSYESTHLPTDTFTTHTGIPLDVDTARSSSDKVSLEAKADRGRPIFSNGAENRKSSERDHVPVFKEHFGDDVGHWSNDLGALSSERIALTLSNITLAEPDREPPPLPAFARNLPSDVTRTTSYSHEVDENSLLARVSELAPPVVPAQHSFTVSPPEISPPKATSRKISATDLSFQSAGLPKHLGSNASRFSFDLAGVGSATQEKLLEDRHKKKATTRTLGGQEKVRHVGNREENADDGEDEEEDYMYDDINDDDNLEERIPGINADAEELLPPNDYDSLRDSQSHGTLEAAVRRSIIPDVTASDTSQVVQGRAESSIKSKHLRDDVTSQSGLAREGSMESSRNEAALMSYCEPSDIDINNVPTPHETRTSAGPSSMVSLTTCDTVYDDLYYDDGVIAQPQEADTYRFDESVFDDETSMFYEHLNPKITARLNNGLSNTASGDPSSWSARDADGHNAGLITQLRNHQFTDVTQLSLSGPSFTTSSQQGPQDAQQQQHGKPGLSRGVGLTQDNLAAYHDALAYATQQATMNGQSAGMRAPGHILPQDLQVSVSPVYSTSHPSDIPERNKIRFNQDDDVFPLDTFGENGDEFDYDDAMEDDPIIAAANAEALENDDEGFYGREFGFYAASSGPGETQYAHGGYLGVRRPDGLTRSHSGRVDFQEPSLTPITERSELSNRNSIISLSLYGPSSAHAVGPHSAPLPSPGLAQLADLMHLRPDDDDLSLSALLKLRRGAWAGSSASLDSAVGSAHSSASPATYANAAALGGAATGSYGVATAVPPASSYSPVSSKGNVSFDDEDDGANSAPASPTITLQTHVSAPAQPVDASPVRRAAVVVGGRGKVGHKRNSSGADSVSYIKEKDDEGEGGVRWVVEKRRTAADTGLVEVLGREVVVGGRI